MGKKKSTARFYFYCNSSRYQSSYEPHMGSLSNAMIYPLKVVLSDPKRANWPSKKCILEETGLGGSDLPFRDKAEIIVRTARRKQNIYGPSMTTVEPFADCHIFGTTAITALGPWGFPKLRTSSLFYIILLLTAWCIGTLSFRKF